MSNYSKTTDFAAKDALSTGNANKIVKGTEIDDEFDAILTAINSKANTNNTALTGTPTTTTAATTTNTTQIASTAFVQAQSLIAGITSGAINNVTIGATTPATEANIDNITINGNTVSSTNSDGAINITPNGTGSVVVSKADINSGVIDNTIIGATTPAAVTGTTISSTTIATKSSMSSSDVVLVMDGNEIKKITQATLVNFTQASVLSGVTGWSPEDTYYSEAAATAWAQGVADAAEADNFNFKVATYRFTSGDREWMAYGTYNYF